MQSAYKTLLLCTLKITDIFIKIDFNLFNTRDTADITWVTIVDPDQPAHPYSLIMIFSLPLYIRLFLKTTCADPD